VDSEVGELQDLLGSASLVSGNGPSHGTLYWGLQQARQRRSVGTESHGRCLRFKLLGMSATCSGRLGGNLGDLGDRTAWAGRRIVEFFGTRLQGSICGIRGFRTAQRPLPPVDISDSFCLKIILLGGTRVFFAGVRGCHHPPASLGPGRRGLPGELLRSAAGSPQAGGPGRACSRFPGPGGWPGVRVMAQAGGSGRHKAAWPPQAPAFQSSESPS
jgi:hypothetical protein